MWPMGGAWLCQHLFDKYEFNGDKEFLKSVYPDIKEASIFFLDFLVEEPGHKWLVVCPSVSPENAPCVNPDESISAGTTMDNQLVFDLFTKTIKAAEILNNDKELVVKLKEAVKRLLLCRLDNGGSYRNGCTIGTARMTAIVMFPICMVFFHLIRFRHIEHRNYFLQQGYH
jgi:alpha-L-fucosidase 2